MLKKKKKAKRGKKEKHHAPKTVGEKKGGWCMHFLVDSPNLEDNSINLI